MSLGVKDESGALDALVDTIDAATLEHTNLSALSSSDLEHLTELSQDLSTDMEHQEISIVESENMHEVIVQEQDIEVEMDKMEIADSKKQPGVPPLRPLTIAPKPMKVPLQIKPVTGQQLLVLQGGTSGQSIKLLSSGQSLNLSNLTLAKPITIKTSGKATGSGLSVVQPKQLVMKKVIPKSQVVKTFDGKQPQQIVVVQKSEPQMKLVQTPTITSGTKTLTLAQAQQMGILSGTKIIPQTGTKQLILNKNASKTIKIVPQIKSPTKILPAPQNQAAKVGPRLYLKPTSVPSSTSVLPSQIIQVAGGQTLNTGQVHQINIPGKGMQYIKFVTTSEASGSSVVQAQKSTNVITKVATSNSGQIKSGNVILSEVKTLPTKTTTIGTKVVKTIATTSAVRSQNLTTSGGQVVVVPAGFLTRPNQTVSKIAIPAMKHTPKLTTQQSLMQVSTNEANTSVDSPELITLESNGMRPRKPCNCTKSQCLKLYCDCFANGEFCYLCNCMNCYNNLENEEHRQRAIKNCLERNPNAFRPKIGKAKDMGDASIRKHTKGCNCKRSGCLKNYCECYEAKIACSSNCKCVGCRNIEYTMEKKNVRTLSNSSFTGTTQPQRKSSISETNLLRNKRATNSKQAFNYITTPVIEATTQCLLTMANNAEEFGQEEELTQKQIIEEFGRCLKQIIDCSITKQGAKH